MKKDNEKDLIKEINDNLLFIKKNAKTEPRRCATPLRVILELATRLFWLQKFGKSPVWVRKGKEFFEFSNARKDEKFKKFFDDVVLGNIKTVYEICSAETHSAYSKKFTFDLVKKLWSMIRDYIKEIERILSIEIIKQEKQEVKQNLEKNVKIETTTTVSDSEEIKKEYIVQYNGAISNIYEEPKDFNYIIFKIKNEVLFNREKGDLYEATRKHWKVKYESVIKYKYAFSVIEGVVREVYFIKKWEDSVLQQGRLMFVGEVAPNEIRDRFIGKTIPEKYRKKGMASPVLFSKNW